MVKKVPNAGARPVTMKTPPPEPADPARSIAPATPPAGLAVRVTGDPNKEAHEAREIHRNAIAGAV